MKDEVKSITTLEEVKKTAPKTVLQVIDKKLHVGTTQAQKPVFNLDETLKIVEDLHKKKRYMDNLHVNLELLENFIIKNDAESLDTNKSLYGCKIEITDDNRNSWSTRNQAILLEVVEFMKSKFYSKLAEIEAQIVLPN